MNLITHSYGQGPDLVLIHGWGLNSGVWQSLIEQLQAHFTLTTIDLPGFGLNCGNLPVQYDLQALARMILPHVPQNACVLGWSLGGLVAQQMALLSPQHLGRLIVVASSPCFIKQADWPGIKPEVLDQFQQQLASNLSATISRFLAIQAMGSPTAKQDIKLLKQQIDQYPQPDPLALAAGLQILAQSDLRSDLATLRMPCDFILGRLDSLVPYALQQQLLTLAPQIKVHLFEKSSHAPFISEPQRFIKLLTELVRN